MPRASYKPFTSYEELFGYAGAKRNAYIALGVTFGALALKIFAAFKTRQNEAIDISGIEVDREKLEERAQLLAEQRDAMALQFSSQEARRRKEPR